MVQRAALQVFYPFVLFYMIAAFLQGGAGTASMGMLNNLRQFLWIPITQNAFRYVPFRHRTPSLAPWESHSEAHIPANSFAARFLQQETAAATGLRLSGTDPTCRQSVWSDSVMLQRPQQCFGLLFIPSEVDQQDAADGEAKKAIAASLNVHSVLLPASEGGGVEGGGLGGCLGMQ